MKNARQAVAQALLQVFQEGAYSNLVMDRLQGYLDPRDAAFAQALFRGVLERAVTLDWAMGCFSKTPPARMTPAVRELLRCGFYQILYMPSVPPSAAVNETVALTRTLGVGSASGFVNGVLRAFLRADEKFPLPRDPLTATAVASGIPAPLIRLWRKSYGPEATQEMLEEMCIRDRSQRDPQGRRPGACAG